MCTPVEIIGIASAVGGTLLQKQSADAAADRQQKIIANAQDETSRRNEQRARTITDFAGDTFDAGNRTQRYEEAALNNEGSLVDALLDSNGGEHGEVEAATTGKVSDDFIRGKATASTKATEDILKRTKLLSRNNAGRLLYNKEALDGANLNSDLSALGHAQTRTNSATNAQLSGVYDQGSLAGGLLSAAGSNAGAIFNKVKPKSASTTAGSGG